MDRTLMLKLWDEAWTDGTWFGSWSKALDGVGAAKAAWKPPAGTHSIWQIVNHVSFWREDTVRKLEGNDKPHDPAEVARMNFEEPTEVSEEKWESARSRLESSHQLLRSAMADESKPVERPLYHLVHDANHLGQILYIRGLQKLPTVMAE
jgi:DinB superfamily